MTRLQAVALGDAPADLVVRGARVLFPETGAKKKRAIAVVDDQIAALPEDPEPIIGPDTTVIDATGLVAIPGLIDAHTHIEAQHAFEYAYPHVLEAGTTSVISESNCLGSLYGATAVEQLLRATAPLAVNVFFTVPPQPLVSTFTPAWGDKTEKDALCDLLTHPRVVGVGEVDWIHVVGRDPPLFDLYDEARTLGTPISGHGAGCKGANLQAFASVVDNDHEAITGEEMISRLENGIHAIGRSGTVRDDTQAVVDAYHEVGPADLSLSTDSVWPGDVREGIYMNRVVRRAIDAGVTPEDAIRMATLNPARHFGLTDRGTLSPGARADIVLLSDLEAVEVETVISGGEVVVENGTATVEPVPYEYPDHFYESVHLPETLDLTVPESVARNGTVRAIEHVTGLFTQDTLAEPAVEAGNLVADPDADVLKVVVIDRHPESDADAFVGFVTGLGLTSGAVATTTAWEAGLTIAVGADDEAIHRAIDHLHELGGGWTVVDDNELTASHPCRVGGFLADIPIDEAAANVEAVSAALRNQGVTADHPMLAVATLTFLGVPILKLTPQGYANILTKELVGLTPE
ncbi:adenine deaminase C-terminal domain-containing protein [Haladaptatus sp. DJG-WS-42]|uniref:adenine deaminase C-terminal domain-containing protein n=1 Tax=Haladaptatus sp. DJG-WS-42 TaxID=3120516 RepID=UPI0030CC654D